MRVTRPPDFRQVIENLPIAVRNDGSSIDLLTGDTAYSVGFLFVCSFALGSSVHFMVVSSAITDSDRGYEHE